MIAGLTALDYAILGVALASMLGVGLWAARGQATASDDFLLAGRSLSWGPLGLSLSLAGLAAAYYCTTPVEAYFVGLKFLLPAALVWAAAPLVLIYVIPLYATLELDSVYEYLELRYDAATRLAAGAVYLVGSLLCLGAVLALPFEALGLGGRVNLEAIFLLLLAGGVATAYTYLGGMKASVLTDALQVVLMIVAAIVILYAIISTLPDGLPQIWEDAEELGRTRIVAAEPNGPPEWADAARETSVWASGFSIVAALPYLVVLPMFFFLADQATVQRFLSARDDQDMIFSYLLGCGLFSLALPVMMYVGMGLMAVYNDRATAPDELRPNWVVHSARDADTGSDRIDSQTVINPETIGELAQQEAILDPTSDRPFTDPQQLLTPRGELNLNRMMLRAPHKWGGEVLLRRGGDELLGHFAARHVPLGLVLAGLVAAAMAAFDSVLTAMTTLVVIDLHRRFGWAEQWLARLCDKEPDDLDQTDEMRLARPVVLVLGAAVILVAVVLLTLGAGLGFLLGVLNIFAGPLLGIFLLGLFTRQTTSPAALAALIWGMLVAVWATLGHHLTAVAAFAPTWPWDGPLGPFWPMLVGLVTTLLVGFVLGFFVGRRKTRNELSGLVAGVGRLGVLLEVTETSRPWEQAEPEEEPDKDQWA